MFMIVGKMFKRNGIDNRMEDFSYMEVVQVVQIKTNVVQLVKMEDVVHQYQQN